MVDIAFCDCNVISCVIHPHVFRFKLILDEKQLRIVNTKNKIVSLLLGNLEKNGFVMKKNDIVYNIANGREKTMTFYLANNKRKMIGTK